MLFAAVIFTIVSGSAASSLKRGSDACLNCTTVCAIVAPSGSTFPCYQGTSQDANFCYNTDPLIDPTSTWSCDTCSDVGYPVYLQNDPIYRNMELWGQSSVASGMTRGSETCLDCTDVCAILPPDGSTFPCYEGSPNNANNCYDTDPLIASTSTYACNTCSSQGYTVYLQNDPIYKNMGLWSKPSVAAESRDKVCDCSADLCSIVPPVGSSFPCYEGTVDDATFCYKTDPLLHPEAVWSCSSCSENGYPVYLQNDPLFQSMELWVTNSK